MIDISKKSWRKYLLFGSLYFAEGIELSVVLVLVPLYFTEKGIALPITTFIIGVALLPWAIKFLWGGIVDHFIGFGRKRFIIVGGILGAVGLFLLEVFDPQTMLVPFVCIIFVGHIGVAFLDVSSDAWAIEITQEHERGKINGAMFAGQYGGLAIGAPLLGLVASSFGYNAAFMTAGFIVALIIIYPLCVQYLIPLKEHQKVSRLLIGEFKKKTTQLVALFTFLLYISYGLLYTIPVYLRVNLQLDIVHIGLITGVYTAMITLGSLIGGGIVDRFGRKPSLFLFIGLSIVFSGLLIIGTSWELFTFLYAIMGFLQGGYTAGEGALCMDITNANIGATQYSLLTSIGNSGDEAATMVSGSLVALLGFSRVFLYSAWAFGPALIVLYFIRPKKNEIQERDHG